MNLDGWEIDIDSLPGPVRGESPCLYFTDAIFPSPDGQRAALLYTICEVAMGWDIGSLAVFADRERPRVTLNPKDFHCSYTNNSVVWLTPTFFAVKKYVYDSKENRLSVPFALIDMERDAFSFLQLDNSYPYTLSYPDGMIKLRECQPDERFPSHDGEQYEIAKLPWRPLDELEIFNQWYGEHRE